MEIRPVPLTQIVRGRDGRQYEVSGSAGQVAADLQAIDPSLRVEFNDTGFFVVIQTIPDGPRKGLDDIVMRVPADDWDGRVVRDFQQRNWEMRHGISAADRLDALDAKRERDADYAYEQNVRGVAQRLFHSLQREVVGSKPRIFVPKRRARAA